jgi:hypothetical protein
MPNPNPTDIPRRTGILPVPISVERRLVSSGRTSATQSIAEQSIAIALATLVRTLDIEAYAFASPTGLCPIPRRTGILPVKRVLSFVHCYIDARVLRERHEGSSGARVTPRLERERGGKATRRL